MTQKGWSASIESICLNHCIKGRSSSKEGIPLNPIYKLFHNDEHLSESIDKLLKNGVSEDDIYMLAHDNDHDRRARKSNDANKIGVSVTGVGTATKNMFRGKSDKLISKMKEIGFEQSKAQHLEEELDKGKTLLVVKNEDEVEF
jgi:Heat induced stress protein YflT